MVNPPLASTAIGVAPPHQAGMASGVNSTFRQIGIATGVAALGSIFSAAMLRHLGSALGPSLAADAPRIVTLTRQGSTGQLLASLPPAARGHVAAAIRSSFAAGVNDLLIVTAGVAIAGAVCAMVLIRGKDFDRTGRYAADGGAGAAGAAAGAGAAPEARPADMPSTAP